MDLETGQSPSSPHGRRELDERAPACRFPTARRRCGGSGPRPHRMRARRPSAGHCGVGQGGRRRRRPGEGGAAARPPRASRCAPRPSPSASNCRRATTPCWRAAKLRNQAVEGGFGAFCIHTMHKAPTPPSPPPSGPGSGPSAVGVRTFPRIAAASSHDAPARRPRDRSRTRRPARRPRSSGRGRLRGDHLQGPPRPLALERGPGRDQRGAQPRGLLGVARLRHRQGLGLPRRPGRDRDHVPRGARGAARPRAPGRDLPPQRGGPARHARLRRRLGRPHLLRGGHHRPGDPARALRAADEARRGVPLRGVVHHRARAGRRRPHRRRDHAQHPRRLDGALLGQAP